MFFSLHGCSGSDKRILTENSAHDSCTSELEVIRKHRHSSHDGFELVLAISVTLISIDFSTSPILDSIHHHMRSCRHLRSFNAQ
jgi:hypothetical protein